MPISGKGIRRRVSLITTRDRDLVRCVLKFNIKVRVDNLRPFNLQQVVIGHYSNTFQIEIKNLVGKLLPDLPLISSWQEPRWK